MMTTQKLTLLLAVLLSVTPKPAHAGPTLQGASSRTVLLVTDSACESKIPALLDQWESDRRAEGWKVLKRIVSPAEASDLRAKLQSLHPDHTFLVGDNVPFLHVVANPDGHTDREIVADYKFVQGAEATPFGAIGRIWFKSQVADVDSIGLYKRYFEKRHTWPKDRIRFGPMVTFDDHLSYLTAGVEWAKRVTGQAPPDRIEHLHLLPDTSDGEIKRRAKSPRLFEIVFSGGQPFVDPGGLYYFGGPAAWRDADPANPGAGPKIAILGVYASSACGIEVKNSFLTAVLTTSYTVASFYNMRGVFAFGPMFTGSTIGDCGRASAQEGFYISSVYGDPTLTITSARK